MYIPLRIILWAFSDIARNNFEVIVSELQESISSKALRHSGYPAPLEPAKTLSRNLYRPANCLIGP